jgi:hypothetical protein
MRKAQVHTSKIREPWVCVVLPHVILLPDASLMMLPEGLGIPFRYPLTD